MASKTLFRSILGRLLPPTDALNHEGAPAHAFTPKHGLAQLAATGCLHATFYADGQAQLSDALALAAQVEPAFIARAAVFARERGHMKDMPALLCALLAVKDRDLLTRVFPRVVDNGKMLRNFVQILRSGAVGRKSLGSLPKRLVRGWLEARGPGGVFRASVGQAPSLGDIVKMVHPKPRNPSEAALYGYLIGKPHDTAALPPEAKGFEDFKARRTDVVPDVPFEMLTALDLGAREWTAIARHASWQMTRMNLNTFARHGVFDEPGMTELIAARLRDAALVRKARVFPYQLLVAYAMAGEGVPREARDSLQDAMEIAIANVPVVAGAAYICPDVSGSMRSPVTGRRKGSTTAMRCVDVAALIAAAFVRRNPSAEVIPFENRVVRVDLNPRDTVFTNAARLAAVGGGGTSTSAPLAFLNERRARGDLVVLVSDNQSWVDARAGLGTETMVQWSAFRERNPKAKLVCIDIQPCLTTQAAEREDILNVGGFSDQVFEVVAEFAAGRLGAAHWVQVIEAIEL
jgi:60 kDa SS-A/Ro ribonucleoprotein